MSLRRQASAQMRSWIARGDLSSPCLWSRGGFWQAREVLMGFVDAIQHDADHTSVPAEIASDVTGDHLVLQGFRCWMAGYETSSIACWEMAWSYYRDTLGDEQSERAIASLSSWVRSICHVHGSAMSCYPCGTRKTCRTECLALEMVSACHHGCDARLQNAARQLVGQDGCHDVVKTCQRYASTLADLGITVSPECAHMVSSNNNGVS